MGDLHAYSSVLTLTEVLPKPVELKRNDLVKRFTDYLTKDSKFKLIEIDQSIAERASHLRGRYPSLAAFDAIQLAAAIESKNDIFITNDKKLRKIKQIEVLVLDDYR